jgi:hypothetical protein
MEETNSQKKNQKIKRKTRLPSKFDESVQVDFFIEDGFLLEEQMHESEEENSGN